MARDDVLILDAGDSTAAARLIRDKTIADLEQYAPAALRRAAQLLRITVYLADQAARKCTAAALHIEHQQREASGT